VQLFGGGNETAISDDGAKFVEDQGVHQGLSRGKTTLAHVGLACFIDEERFLASLEMTEQPCA
jgi:hypothetical protein